MVRGGGGGGGVSVCGVGGVVLMATLLTHYLTHYFPSITLQDTCNSDCIDTFFAGVHNLASPALLPTLRAHFLYPPTPIPAPTEHFDVGRPVWRELLNWDEMQTILKDMWEGQPPGVFVEVGASDGEFMSQTVMLEKNLGWTGLLVEPDPRAFTILQQKRPRAWKSPVCIHRRAPCSEQLWVHDLIPDLPDDLQALVRARSKLLHETVVGDLKQGRTLRVPCVPLSRLLLAADLTRVDLLSIATGTVADQLKIRDVTSSNTFFVKTVLIQYPRAYLLDHPYPFVPGYLLDMERSLLLTKLYWRKTECELVGEGECRRARHYDLVESCRKFRCLGKFTVWTFALPEDGVGEGNSTLSSKPVAQ